MTPSGEENGVRIYRRALQRAPQNGLLVRVAGEDGRGLREVPVVFCIVKGDAIGRRPLKEDILLESVTDRGGEVLVEKTKEALFGAPADGAVPVIAVNPDWAGGHVSSAGTEYLTVTDEMWRQVTLVRLGTRGR